MYRNVIYILYIAHMSLPPLILCLKEGIVRNRMGGVLRILVVILIALSLLASEGTSSTNNQ